MRYLSDNNLADNDYACDTLSTLYDAIHVFVNESTSLDIKDFKNFIIERRAIMRKYLKNIVELN